MQQQRRLWNPSLPQTLLIATFLLYANVVVALLFRSGNQGLFTVLAASLLRSLDGARGLGSILSLVFVVGSAGAGFLVSNERKVGWKLAVGVAALPLVAYLVVMVAGYPQRFSPLEFDLLSVLFDVALFALLVHPMSRDHQRVWFT